MILSREPKILNSLDAPGWQFARPRFLGASRPTTLLLEAIAEGLSSVQYWQSFVVDLVLFDISIDRR